MNSSPRLCLAICEAIAQPHDPVVGPGHYHLVAPGRLELVAQGQPHAQSHVLFLELRGAADRAGIDAAMARVDHDDAFGDGRRRLSCRRPHHHHRGRLGFARCRHGGDLAIDRLMPAIDRHLDQVGHNAVTVRAARRQLEHAIDLERLRHVENDARHPRTGPPEAETLDQPDRFGCGGVDGPVDLGQIDREPRGLAEADVTIADRLAEIDHHAGGIAVLGEANVFDARLPGVGFTHPGAADHRGQRNAHQQLPPTRPASCSGRNGLPGPRSTALLALHSAAGWLARTCRWIFGL